MAKKDNKVILKVINDAKAPKNDKGLISIYSDTDIVVESKWRALIKTGIEATIPEGFIGLITSIKELSISGLAIANSPSIISNGELDIIVINHGPNPITINRGDLIAYLIVIPLNTEIEE